MKRLIFFMIMIAGAISFVVSCANKEEVLKARINVYYVDSEINRLLPYEKDIIDADRQAMAESALDLLSEGWDENDKIRRLIPKRKKCINVIVKGDTAYVDISSEIKKDLPVSRDIEKLFVYQITNTLTEINGIRFVKFTIDGKIRKNFMGFLDMRETYKHRFPE